MLSVERRRSPAACGRGKFIVRTRDSGGIFTVSEVRLVNSKKSTACFAVAVLSPLLLGAVSVAAGHVLWSRVDQPAIVAAYCNYRLDRVIVAVNGAMCAGIVGAAAFLIPRRRSLATVVAIASSLASLPAYSIAYHSTIRVVQWLGLGWSSSA